MASTRKHLSLPTPRLLRSLGVPAGTEADWSVALTQPCIDASITTPNRLAAFLGNVLHETGRFARLTENLNYSVEGLLANFGAHRGINAESAARLGRRPRARPLTRAQQNAIADVIYGGPWGLKNLGNREPGDGSRFLGRSLIQLTGRSNYERFARQIGRPVPVRDDFLAYLETREGAALSATQFWTAARCNPLADRATQESLTELRRVVNGGSKGLQEVLGLTALAFALIQRDESTPPHVRTLSPV